MNDSSWLRLAIVAGALAALVYLAKSLWDLAAFVFDIIVLVFLAWIVAAAMRRLAGVIRGVLRPRFRWLGIPVAYLIAILSFVVFVSVLIPLTIVQALNLSKDLPLYADRINRTFEQARERARELGIFIEIPQVEEGRTVEALGTAVSEWLAENILGIVQGATATIFQIVLILVISIYMVLDAERLQALFYRFLPTAYHGSARHVLRRLDIAFFSYLRGISIIAVVYSVAITIIMLIADLPFALPLGLAAGLIQLVPIIGEVVALGIPIAVAFLTKSPAVAIAVTVVLLLLSLVMNNFVSPRVHSRGLKMPGLFVILGVVLGTRVAGIWGAVLGVPMVAFLYSLAIAWAERGTLDESDTEESSDPSPSPT